MDTDNDFKAIVWKRQALHNVGDDIHPGKGKMSEFTQPYGVIGPQPSANALAWSLERQHFLLAANEEGLSKITQEDGTCFDTRITRRSPHDSSIVGVESDSD